MIDQDAAIVERHDLHVGWKPGLDLVDLLFDRVDDLARIGAIANHHYAAHRFLAAFIENAAPELGTQLHIANIAQSYGRAVVSAERNVFDVLEAADQPDAAHNVLCASTLDHLRAHVVVTALDSGDHIFERHVVRAQLYGIEVDLILLYASSHAGHFSH